MMSQTGLGVQLALGAGPSAFRDVAIPLRVVGASPGRTNPALDHAAEGTRYRG